MKKTNTGLEAYYYDPETGEEMASDIMYDWEKLYASDESVIYAGFAAARNMTIKTWQSLQIGNLIIRQN